MYEKPSLTTIQLIQSRIPIGKIRGPNTSGEVEFEFCPYCGGGKHRERYKFSVNLSNGMFNCLRSSCGVRGSWHRFCEDFGLIESEQRTETKTFRTFKNTKPPEAKPKGIVYMNTRGISLGTMNKYNVYSTNNDILVFPIYEGTEIVNFKYRNPYFEKGVSQGAKEWFEKDCKPYIYGAQTYNGDPSRMVLTEGQMDALSCYESGVENAFSVPGGARGFTWWPYSYEFVSQFKELIIFGDCEHGHITLLEEMRARFSGVIRCVTMESYRGCKDANELLLKYGKTAVYDAVRNAQLVPIKHIRQLADVESTREKAPKLKTGFPSINKILGGGLAFGGVTVVTGKSGEGKSVMVGSILIEAREQGYNVFAYSGELPDEQFKQWIDLQVVGTHCIPYHDSFGNEIGYTISDANRQIVNDWYRDHIFLYSFESLDNKAEADEPLSLCDAIKQSIMQYSCKVILIDNLMTGLSLERSKYTDTNERQKDFIDKLRNIAKTFGVCILLVAHKRKGGYGGGGFASDEILGASEIANYAYTILSYERGEDIAPEDRYLKVIKNRENGRLEEKGVVIKYDEKSKRVFEEVKGRPAWEPEYGRIKEYSCFKGVKQDDDGSPDIQDLDFD